MLFLVCLSEQVRIGVIVLEDSTMMGQVFISNMIRRALSPIDHVSLSLFIFQTGGNIQGSVPYWVRSLPRLPW